MCALDVGYGQLHPKLRDDPRVTVLERTNVRELSAARTAVRAHVRHLRRVVHRARQGTPAGACDAAPGWRALVLVKPQFEAGPGEVGKGGVVRDPELRQRIVDGVAGRVPEWGGRVVGVVDSGLPGPKGNREFFLYVLDAS